jgi:hypothetical protein
MRNFNEGMDYLTNHGLLGLVTASTLFVWTCAQQESDVDPTATYVGGQCVQVGAVVITCGSLTSANRIIDLGAADFTALASGSVKSVVVTTKTPGSGALLLAIQNINAGSAVDAATQGPIIVDDLKIELAYLVSGSVA